jgi:hypothetical protein
MEGAQFLMVTIILAMAFYFTTMWGLSGVQASVTLLVGLYHSR